MTSAATAQHIQSTMMTWHGAPRCRLRRITLGQHEIRKHKANEKEELPRGLSVI